jgi:RimJ/RimL family protein N-acetyltransferase
METRDRDHLEHEDCTIRTARLVLRRPRAADADAIARLANDRVIAENTAMIPHPYTPAHAQGWIAQERGEGEASFVAFADVDGAEVLIGAGGFSRGEGGVPELGYWIGAPYRGRGYATELARALVDHAFETMGAERITVSCRVTNTASRRVIEKCGFQWFGCGLAGSLGFKGAFPVDRFRLEHRIWESLLAWGRGRVCPGPSQADDMLKRAS